MSYTVGLASSAERDLRWLDAKLRARIEKGIDRLSGDPRKAGDVKPLKGSGDWRLRVGDYRVIFSIDDKAKTVTVLEVVKRGDAYR